jgi:hypothetical protein
MKAVDTQVTKAAILFCIGSDDAVGAVGGTIRDNQYLELSIVILCEKRLDTPADIFFLVSGRYHDGDGWFHPAGAAPPFKAEESDDENEGETTE